MIDDLITQEEVDAALLQLKEEVSKYSNDKTSLGHMMHMMYSHTYDYIESNFKRGDDYETKEQDE